MTLLRLLAAGAVLLGLASCSKLPSMPKIPVLGESKKPDATADFRTQVKPLLQARCLPCHNSQKAERNLNLETRSTANTTWRGGPVIIPGEPEKSMLYQVLLLAPYGGGGGNQPHQISFDDRKLIYTWIGEGAYWPAGEEGRLSAPAAAPTP